MPELMTKQEVAKELLKPYFDDPSLCSTSEDEGECVYNGPGGRMSAFARACTPEGREKLTEVGDPPYVILDDLGSDILQEKYRHIEDQYFWSRLEKAHDELATGSEWHASDLYGKLTGEKYQRS